MAVTQKELELAWKQIEEERDKEAKNAIDAKQWLKENIGVRDCICEVPSNYIYTKISPNPHIYTFVLLYKKESKKLISFQCLPFEPPIGGSKCEECNKDPFRPCS